MSDNKVIRTTVLSVILGLPRDSKFVVQKAAGTFKTSWQTLMSVLTANVPIVTAGPTTPPPTTHITTPGPTTPPPTTQPGDTDPPDTDPPTDGPTEEPTTPSPTTTAGPTTPPPSTPPPTTPNPFFVQSFITSWPAHAGLGDNISVDFEADAFGPGNTIASFDWSVGSDSGSGGTGSSSESTTGGHTVDSGDVAQGYVQHSTNCSDVHGNSDGESQATLVP